ncbi:Hsp20/alpha crystallin family protein [Falsiroseomonas sp. HC035]|uniref:Hsp20/alpha crystallin family protein n=1 Tax=Falsiroseomonas sp. HC035 TaxID=3390999 RepID=UPI003D3172AE
MDHERIEKHGEIRTEGARSGRCPAESFWQPFVALRSEVDRLFDSFWRGNETGGLARRAEAEPQPLWRFESGFGPAVPAIDVLETEKEFRIEAKLPGMDANDVELALSDGVLMIKKEGRAREEDRKLSLREAPLRFLPASSWRRPGASRGELRQGRADGDAAQEGGRSRAAAQDRHQARSVMAGHQAGATFGWR